MCTSAPAHGKAFCAEHLEFLQTNHPSIPTDLRGFLKHCGVLKGNDTTDSTCKCFPGTNINFLMVVYVPMLTCLV